MSGRIRGHYRIDSSGRVEPIADVNAAANPCNNPRTVLAKQPGTVRSRLKRMSVAGTGVLILGASMPLAMPRIEHALLVAQAAHFASVRASYIQSHPGLQIVLNHHR